MVVLHNGEILAEGMPGQFMAEMDSRVFLITPGAGDKARRIYSGLAAQKEVVDVTIRSGMVRLVTGGKRKAAEIELPPGDSPTTVVPAAATFEDAFMALIPQGDRHSQNLASVPEDFGDDEVVVETRGLEKMFGSFAAVRDLSFGVRRGEIFGLLGPNGAGKSTTFRMLCGLLPASSGAISVAGYDLRRSRARARSRLGYMAQQFSLYGQLTVRENLLFFGKAYGLWGSKLEHRLQWAYDEFGLAAWRDTAAVALPGGYKQRLAMAAALLHQPDILFLDEPTSGVDPFARREFWLRINGFAEQGMTVVVTTHFMEEAEYCDRMLIMSQGATLAAGTPAEIRALARTRSTPAPSMDDAFIFLAEQAARGVQ